MDNRLENWIIGAWGNRPKVPRSVLLGDAPKEKNAVFLKFEASRVDLIARTKNKITMAR